MVAKGPSIETQILSVYINCWVEPCLSISFTEDIALYNWSKCDKQHSGQILSNKY